MEWYLHNKWAAKLGIDETISQGVNSLVDDIGDEDLAEEFKREKERYEAEILEKKDIAKGNSALGAVISYHNKGHEPERNLTTDSKIYAEIRREFLKDKGEDYIKAWYLHHHLDYLDEEYQPRSDIEELQEEHRQKYPQTFSGYIQEFLNQHQEELAKDLAK